MVTIEVCYIDNVKEQNFNIAKTLHKLHTVEALPNSDIWIKINSNFIRALLPLGLINKNGCFVQLSELGASTNVVWDEIKLSLEEFLTIDNVEDFVYRSCNVMCGKDSIKVTHSTCYHCNKERKTLTHIVSNQGQEGNFCSQCLKKGLNALFLHSDR